AGQVRERVLASRDRFWRPDSFGDHSPDAVAQALSRLARDGELRRVRRGLYWRGAPTRLGLAPPPPDRLAREVAGQSRGTGPAGRSAALALGLSTQVPRHETIAVPARAPSSQAGLRLVSRAASVKRRSERLSPAEVALLEVLRAWDVLVEAPAGEAASRIADLVDSGVIRADRLARAAATEPPVVREGLRNLLGSVGRPEAAASVPRARSQSFRGKMDLAG
ncbi:MAG: DUF6088 family protein, partial [Streptosporangiaceae bacterium]